MDDKYTKIHNKVLESLAKSPVLSAETRILFVIWRKTYGYGKKQDKISISQFVEDTGLHTRTVSRALESLQEKKLISRKAMLTSFLKPTSGEVARSGRGPRSTRQTQKKTKENILLRNASTISSPTPTTADSLKQNSPFSYILHEENLSNPIKQLYNSKAIVRLISYTARVQGVPTLGNWGKQTKLIHDMLDKGVTMEQIKEAVDNMLQDPYWRGFKFDFVNVSSNIHRYVKAKELEPLDETERIVQQAQSPEFVDKWEKTFDRIRKGYA